MKIKTLWLVVMVAAGLVLAAGVSGALLAAPEGPGDVASPAADVAATIAYQGRLTNPGGTPLSGSFLMRFQVYTALTGGTLVWDSGTVTIAVDRGLFNAALAVNPASFNGQGLWLQLYVNGEWLSPRQALLPVPYALSLRPGAQIRTATGEALRGTSIGGYGLAGYTDDGYGVQGVDAGTTPARGYGGYFTSANGVGVYGYSGATSHFSNVHTPGVYGRSANGAGVYGVGDNGTGVLGESAGDSGVRGRSTSGDLNDAGVSGSAGGVRGVGVRGYRYGTGFGVQGTTYGTTGGSGVAGMSESHVGVWAESDSYYGLYARTNRDDDNYGIYTLDNIYAQNYHSSGAIMSVAQNGGSEALEPGDVVAFSGVVAPADEGGAPLIQVARTLSAGDPAVAGVVVSGFDLDAVTQEQQAIGQEAEAARTVTLEGPIPPGGYLLLAVQGPVRAKVSSASAIEPGALLSSGPRAGCAQPLPQLSVTGGATGQPGTVLGKALEAWSGGQGMIYVYVTLQ